MQLNKLFYLTGILAISCSSIRNHAGADSDERKITKDCGRFSTKHSYDRTLSPDTVYIKGRLRKCQSNEIIKYGGVSFKNRNGDTFIANVDKRGFYKIALTPDLYDVSFGSIDSRLDVPDLEIGQYGNVLILNASTKEIVVFINELKDPKLEKEIEKLKYKMK